LILLEVKKKQLNLVTKQWEFFLVKMNFTNYIKGLSGMMRKEIGPYLILLSIQSRRMLLFQPSTPRLEMNSKKMIVKLLYTRAMNNHNENRRTQAARRPTIA
jgi:hypothetical protein